MKLSWLNRVAAPLRVLVEETNATSACSSGRKSTAEQHLMRRAASAAAQQVQLGGISVRIDHKGETWRCFLEEAEGV